MNQRRREVKTALRDVKASYNGVIIGEFALQRQKRALPEQPSHVVESMRYGISVDVLIGVVAGWASGCRLALKQG